MYPRTNFVGLLQEKCNATKKPTPVYLDVVADDKNTSMKQCVCTVHTWTTQGSGSCKKIAKQHAAELMLKIIENNINTPCQHNPLPSAAMKINVFCGKSGKSEPSLVKNEKENGLTVVQYTFEGYTATGKGDSKKAATEQALEDIANHFHINKFYENLSKYKERIKQQMNPLVKLHQHCQMEKLPSPSFSEEKVQFGKTAQFVVTCSLKDYMTKSKLKCSKKEARLEASMLMLQELNKTTHFNATDTSQNSP